MVEKEKMADETQTKKAEPAKPKEEPKEEPAKSKESKDKANQNRKTKWILCCCGGAFFIFIVIFIALFLVPFLNAYFSSSSNNSVPSMTPTTGVQSSAPAQNTQAETTQYPAPQDCQQANTPPAAVLSISTDNPGLKQDVNVYYYPIYGYTYNQIINQINECGVKTQDGNFAGTTNYNISSQFLYNSTAHSCSLKNVVVGVRIDIYYPQWQKPDNFASGLDNQWQQYISSLTNHENTHKQMDLGAAQKLLNQMSNISAATCNEAGTEAQSVSDQVLGQLKADNADFDARTNHGANPD